MLIRREVARRDTFEIEKGVHRYNSLVILLRGEFEYTVFNETKRVLHFEPVVFKKGVSFIKKVISPIEFVIITSLRFSFGNNFFLQYEENEKKRLISTVNLLVKAIKDNASDDVIEHFANDIFITSTINDTKEKIHSMPVCEYIENNFSKKLSLKLLAEVNCSSVQTLITTFKKNTGKTPVEYINDLRIKKAKEFLTNTDFTITKISELCGFENVYYFSNVFKKMTGVSPLKFRNSLLL